MESSEPTYVPGRTAASVESTEALAPSVPSTEVEPTESVGMFARCAALQREYPHRDWSDKVLLKSKQYDYWVIIGRNSRKPRAMCVLAIDAQEMSGYVTVNRFEGTVDDSAEELAGSYETKLGGRLHESGQVDEDERSEITRDFATAKIQEP